MVDIVPFPSSINSAAAGGNATWYNVNPRNLKRWRAALANQRAGIADASIVCIGDSTTAGHLGATSYTAARKSSYPVRLAERMNVSYGGVSAVHNYTQNLLGGASPSNIVLKTYDERITYTGGGWDNADVNRTIFGGAIRNNTSTSDLNLAIPVGSDRVDIYTLRNSGLGSFDVLIGATNLASISTANATPDIQKTTVSFTKTVLAETLIIRKTSGASSDVNIGKVLFRDSAAPLVHVVNAGWGGAKISDFEDDSAPFTPLSNADQFDNHLYIVMMTINDNLTDQTAYKASYQEVITALKTHADVVLATGFPNASTNSVYASINYQLADENDLVLLDMQKRFSPFAEQNAIMPYADSRHLTAQGYADAAQAAATFLQFLS